METKNWTGISLLREAYNRLTPKNWLKGDFYEWNDERNIAQYCIVGMCANILGIEEGYEEEAEKFLREFNLPVNEIEIANDNSSTLAVLRKKLSEIIGKPF